MKDHKHAQLLLDLADRDLQALRHMLDTRAFADAIFGFHAQQSVEKLCKAWLTLFGVTYPRTHDLRALFGLIEDDDPGSMEEFMILIDLTDYGVQFRYDTTADLLPLDRAAVLRDLDRFRRKVVSFMPSE